MMLQKRGPLHTIFDRKSDDALSIDVPLRISTLIDGGRILVKVQSTDGPSLIVLRAAHWGSYKSVQPQGSSENGETAICRNMGGAENDVLMLPLCTNQLQWFRILGVYKGDAVFC